MPGRTRSAPGSDAVDRLLAQWRTQRPDLDASATAVIGRIARAGTLLRRRADERLAAEGLTWETFAVLAALRRQGPPYALTPSELYREALLTSGAMTNRIDRVEAQGWVQRQPDPADRRSVRVQLTRSGRELIDRAIAAHFAAQSDLLGGFTRAEQREFADMLARLIERLQQN